MCPPDYDVAALEDLPAGSMRAVQVDGEPVLLVREGESVSAIGGTCPHAGAPLAQGIRNGSRIVCPWHKATFCTRTGKLLEPPAVDDVPRYDVRIEAGRIHLTGPIAPEPPQRRRAPDPCFVIIGGGAAGAVAAQTLRQSGFAGRLIILDRYNRVPYDRTILSKYTLSGLPGAEKSPLQSQAFYRDLDIERQTAEVIRLNPRTRLITCANGTTLAYDQALLATGGIPKIPDLPGARLRNVFALRAQEDAQAILAQAERSRTAVVLGSGFIGMEVAASLRERGLDVTVVGKERTPFEQQLGARVGQAFIHLHESRGMAFRLGQNIDAITGNRHVTGVRLQSGETLQADLVVAGFGIIPATGYLEDVPLNADGSITVGPDLRVTDGLYAAGDIVRFPLFGDGPPIRVEHWRVAQQHGRVAALNMMGQGVRYDATPIFWTIQYLKRLDYIGHASEWDDIVVHGDLRKPEFLAYYVKGRQVIAAAGLDRDQDTAALIELFDHRRPWTAAELGSSPAGLLAS